MENPKHGRRNSQFTETVKAINMYLDMTISVEQDLRMSLRRHIHVYQ